MPYPLVEMLKKASKMQADNPNPVSTGEIPQILLLPDPAFTLSKKDLPLPEGFIEGNTIGINVSPVARLQTDSMIISGFINVTLSGFVDNYNMVLNSVANVVNIVFNSVLSGFGNLIATESREKQYRIFKVYRFAAC